LKAERFQKILTRKIDLFALFRKLFITCRRSPCILRTCWVHWVLFSVLSQKGRNTQITFSYINHPISIKWQIFEATQEL